MSRDLLRRGFKFVGSTICYALMQATGMVNDHLVTCPRHAELGGTRHARIATLSRCGRRRRKCEIGPKKLKQNPAKRTKGHGRSANSPFLAFVPFC
jgi:Methyladenine glycosylase